MSKTQFWPIVVRNCKESEILLYLQANIDYNSFVHSGRRHETPEPDEE